MSLRGNWTPPVGEERESHLRLVALAALKAIEAQGCLDSKRPLGNSSIELDVLEACGIEPAGEEYGDPVFTEDQEQYAWELWTQWPSWARGRLE